jgi:hypothetical protein
MICQVCYTKTSGEMGTGELIPGKNSSSSWWWCRLCHKCPHYDCRKIRSGGNEHLHSHCGLKCSTKQCCCKYK